MNKNFKYGILSIFMMIVLIGCNTTPAGETVQDEYVQGSQEGELVDIDVPSTEEVTAEDETVSPEESSSDQGEVEDPSTEVTTGPETNISESDGIENVEFSVSLNQAVDTFHETFGSTEINIDKVEFERDDGRYKYKIDGWDGVNEYELKIDAETNEILEQETESDTDTDDIIDFSRVISPSEAMAIALTEAGGGYVKEWELEADDNKVEYEIDIEGAEDQDVDAYSGEIR